MSTFNVDRQRYMVPCPLCSGSEHTAVCPTTKTHWEDGKRYVHPDIRIVVCDCCGLVYENPQVPAEVYAEYSDRHYYNTQNNLQDHDAHQWRSNAYRWSLLKDRLPWGDMLRIADIGASGAWSAWVKRHHPQLESVLVEPSSEAIRACRDRYPEVVPVLSTFESFEEQAGSFDFLSFFYSIYMVKNPAPSLRKAYELLRPGGRMLICISHILAEVEVWNNAKTPFLDLSYFVRGVPLVYFSRRTLAKFLEGAGLDVVETFVAQYPNVGATQGRQEYYVIAERPRSEGTVRSVEYADAKEVEWSANFVRNVCVTATQKSIAAFLARHRGGRIIVVQDDETYGAWIRDEFARQGVDVECVGLKPEVSLVAHNLPRDTKVLLNATDHKLDAVLAVRPEVEIRDCLLRNRADPYGKWFEFAGERIISRAFLPESSYDVELFPFPRAVPINDVNDTTAYDQTGPRAQVG